MKNKFNYLHAFGFVVAAELAGFLGSLAMGNSIGGWYTTIEKPFFSPPNWIFGPVWILLYALMGISAYLIWQERDIKAAKNLLTIYWIHLLVNMLWSYVFFNLHLLGWAAVHLGILWCLVLYLTVKFQRISRPASWLFVPYFLWVSFAFVLNYYIWFLN